MRHIVIMRADGGVSHMRLVDGADVGAEIDKWELVNVRAAVGWREASPAELPSRRWREAWTLATIDAAVTVDLVAARKIRRAELQELRAKLAARLRDEIEAAEDAGQAARLANLKTKRRALRELDLAARLATVTDLATLDTYVPPEMGEP